ncbi:MAG: hypothetical protein HYU30_10555 [Chloroflexi bacterium]|nr:hypothetical protein [Chloroflexota bacterium]
MANVVPGQNGRSFPAPGRPPRPPREPEADSADPDAGLPALGSRDGAAQGHHECQTSEGGE